MMNWEDIVYDPGSTTKAFKFLTNNYNLEVLLSQVEGDCFQRIVRISLDGMPVMIALSTTKLKNSLFLDILQNAHNIPIGVRLFAPGSGITREAMQVSKLDYAMLDNNRVKTYIPPIKPDEVLYYRSSVFNCGAESMELKEYVLPGLKYICEKYQT